MWRSQNWKELRDITRGGVYIGGYYRQRLRIPFADCSRVIKPQGENPIIPRVYSISVHKTKTQARLILDGGVMGVSIVRVASFTARI